MRTLGGSAQRYVAGIVPDDPARLAAFLRTELTAVQTALALIADGQLDLITVAPVKPRDGMMRYGAAGVLGTGQGFYGYYAGGWKFLG